MDQAAALYRSASAPRRSCGGLRPKAALAIPAPTRRQVWAPYTTYVSQFARSRAATALPRRAVAGAVADLAPELDDFHNCRGAGATTVPRLVEIVRSGTDFGARRQAACRVRADAPEIFAAIEAPALPLRERSCRLARTRRCWTSYTCTVSSLSVLAQSPDDQVRRTLRRSVRNRSV
jgi:hypothetical protein